MRGERNSRQPCLDSGLIADPSVAGVAAAGPIQAGRRRLPWTREAEAESLDRGRVALGENIMARQQWAVGAGVLLGLLVLVVAGRADEAAAVKAIESWVARSRGTRT